VNIRLVEQGFLLGSDDNEIDDHIKSLEPVANGILAKLNIEQILDARLDPGFVGRISSTSSHD
jgi:hypothetical protein